MMNRFLVLFIFMVLAVSGCAGIDYSKNQGALAAYRAGQSDRAVCDQAFIERRAYRDGYNQSRPDINFSVGAGNGKSYGSFHYSSAPYGHYGYGAGYGPSRLLRLWGGW
jgi:hypothetical protein